MKRIGLIGGMSWESTAHYYEAINKQVSGRLGGLHSADILVHSLDFAPVATMQEEGRWDEAGALLAESASLLEAAGCDLIGLATNTMHKLAPAIEAAISVPFIHIADPTAKALLADGYQRVGLLGTRFTMEMPFYIERMAELGVETFPPGVDHTNLNGIIYEELCKGVVRDESRAVYVSAIERMQMMGAEAVILGCTEIGMLITDDDSPLPVFDTTELHAAALADAALAD
ncbi:aspartate/glutamate racemase family protein [Cucumibacter marinus]|uniref:aspartate/glutamate racemase family protein n=1 Tax=Cucumibacter marinus TaxID=1121252 RepID=UPI00041A3ECA|nr:aspartate/glutamate racemase family protein [Cucumibacter marinus]